MKISPILFISTLNILLAFVILFNNWKKNKAIIFLSTFIFLLSVYLITISLTNEGGPVWLYALLLNNAAPFYYLIPVSLFFYIRTTFTDSIRFKKFDFLHLLPFAINLIGITPYLFSSFEYKYESAEKTIGNIEAFANFDFKMLYPLEVNQVGRPLQFIIYIFVCLYLIIKFLPKLKASSGAVKSQFNFMFYHFVIILLLIFIFNICYLNLSVNYLLNHDLEYTSKLINQNLKFISVFYFCIPLYFLLNPRLTYGLSQTAKHIDKKDRNNKNEKGIENNNRNLKDDNVYFLSLTDKIIAFLETDKPFLNPEFSVHVICQKLNVPRHHIQYCLNFVMNKKFTDLKNEMRVNHSKLLLQNDAVTDMSIDGIGKHSGFASASNFFTTFKKVTGYTPNQWLNLNKQKNNQAEL